jgi:hypothetical protein
VFLAGQRKIEEAAEASPELKRAARQNARRTLTALLTSLGFETVDVRFAPIAP